MKWTLCTLILAVGLTSCKVVCDAEKVLVDGLAGAVAASLECKNVTQINADIKAILDKATLCEAPKIEGVQGPIGGLVCPLIAGIAVSFLGTKIPENWQCDPAKAKGALAAVISMGCTALLPI